jgi:hypothetical protein
MEEDDALPNTVLVCPEGGTANYQDKLEVLHDFMRICAGVSMPERRLRPAQVAGARLGEVPYIQTLTHLLQWVCDMMGQPREAKVFDEHLAGHAGVGRERLIWSLWTELVCRGPSVDGQGADEPVVLDVALARPALAGGGLTQRERFRRMEVSRKIGYCLAISRTVEKIWRHLILLQRLQRNPMDVSAPQSFDAQRFYEENLGEGAVDGGARLAGAAGTGAGEREKMSDYEKLLRYLLRQAAKKRYRKLGGIVYAERTVSISGTCYGTRAWEPVVFNASRPDSDASTIRAFVYANCRKEECLDMWSSLVALRNPQSLIQHLAEADELEFPFLKRSRHILSFRNGIYNTADETNTGVFYAYQAVHLYLGPEVVAAKYFDMDVDGRWLDIASNGANSLGWWDIPTPLFQSILDYQNFGCSRNDDMDASSTSEQEGDEPGPERLPLGRLEEGQAKRMLAQLENAMLPRLYQMKHASAEEVPLHLEALRQLAGQFEEDLRARQEALQQHGGLNEAAGASSAETDRHHGDAPDRQPGNALPVDAQRWIYVMLGRLLHEVGTFDNFQIMPFIKGVANSGKSTAAHIAKHFFSPSDVGVLSSNSEAKFGLSALYDKFCFVCFELKKSVSLSAAEFQSMVSGEECSIAIKHATAQTHKWKVPGLLCGNEAPGWVDSQGSIARRLLIINFRYGVNNKDSRPDLLQEILTRELAALIVKCNTAYRNAAQVHSGEDIWKILPQYFHDERRNLLRDSDPLYSTIWDKFHWELFVQAPSGANFDDYFALWDDFEQDYKMRFRSMRGTQFVDPLIDDKIAVPFAEAGLRKQACSKNVNGVDRSDLYILGIRPRRRAAGGAAQAAPL